MKTKNQEIEVRFLNIDKDELITKLKALGAEDLGEQLLTESIFSDTQLKFSSQGKMIRIRSVGSDHFLTYKHHHTDSATGTIEVELKIDDAKKAKEFLKQLGFVLIRQQEKKRHKFILGGVILDIDTWPKVPPYLELEGESEEELKKTAELLGFEWNKVTLENAKKLIEKYYGIPVGNLKKFTFDLIE